MSYPQHTMRNSPHTTQVAIVGGGIAGLATAYYLQKRTRQNNLPLSYTLIESSSTFGGKIDTEANQGFVIEGGPDSFITQKPDALNLCRELGIEDQLMGTNDTLRRVYVLDDGQLRPLPDGVMLVVPTKFMPFVLSPLISLPGKIRMGLDLVIPPRREDGDESLSRFIHRRLGREALDKIAEPLMAGIYVAEAERLSLQATFPRFINLEQKHGSLIKGMLIQKARQTGRSRTSNGREHSIFMTLRGGLQGLVEALVDQLEGTLLLNRQVVGLGRDASKSGEPYHLGLDNGNTLRADAVVLATPAYVAADLIEPMHTDLAQELRAIRYVSTATVSLGYQADEFEHPLNGFGFVVSRRERTRLLACTWTSTKFEQRAPHQHVLLRAFVGGPRDESAVDLPDEALVGLVRDELKRIMRIHARPVVARVYRWPKANPQYDVGHLDRVDKIEAATRAHLPQLYLTGSAYRGIGIPDCIKQGRSTAEALVEAFKHLAAASHAR